jgi:HD-GYP domain-containing protein (c-di-GMP phosphodiesterase class II)
MSGNRISGLNIFKGRQREWLAFTGIVVNVLLAFLMNKFGLFLFLDTIGTIVVSALAGFFPGILTAVVTNAICTLFNPNAAYFSFLNALVAIFTVWFLKKDSHKKISGFIIYVLVVAFVSTSVSAAINWNLLDGAQIARNSETTELLAASMGIPLFWAYYIYLLLLNIIDKGISAIATWILMAIIPKETLEGIERSNWKQRPLTPEDVAGLKIWGKDIRFGMRTRTILTIVSTALLLVFVTGLIGFSMYYSNVKQERTIDALNMLKLCDEVIDHEKIDDYMAGGPSVEGYLETQELLSRIKVSCQDVEDLYFIKFSRDAGRRIFDLDENQAQSIPRKIEYNEDLLPHVSEFLNGDNISPIEHDSVHGLVRSVFYPIKDSNGRVACYAVADVSISNLQSYIKSFFVKALFILSGFFILVLSFSLLVTNANMVYPIRSIAKRVDDFSSYGNEQEQLDKYVKRIRSLDINTGDEVEKLFDAICKMTLNIAEQMRDLRRLSDTTAKMQDGLIVTMADMVENRDSDTGAHIQKTAAYVKIIVEGLQKKGYYAEKINAKFISDVVRSAPLHDIGKISIPDAVLNKPGKLSDEEYEIIKTHAVMGKKIMEDAISTVEGENYLKEARNMAAYHHERWDGKGYPEGLHGEVIPLSARIMAVADVFDALTSPRVYKPAFPLEKALSIINEGSGTQFDPKCVEVLMDNLPEVKVILKKYNRDL